MIAERISSNAPRVAEPALAAAMSVLQRRTQAPQSAAAGAVQEFLAFKLGGQEYGIEILRVQEIRSYEKPTRIASAPEHLLGVLNLRGVIVPVVDMRLKFELGEPQYNRFTVVIVLNVRERVVGMVVDAVSDVVSLATEQLRPVPEFGAAIPSEHLLAIGTMDDRLLTLLNIDRLLASPDMGLVAA